MRQSTLLAVNTLTTIGRMALTVVLGLITTRLVLAALGPVDFGLLSALGAAGAFLALVTIALTQSTQRHMAFELGKGDTDALVRTFNTSLVLFMMVGVGLWLVGVAATSLVLSALTIPADRADAAWWCYQVALLSLATTVAITPYRSIMAARQQLFLSAIIDACQAVLRLSAAVLILPLGTDMLITWVFARLGILLIVLVALLVICLGRYAESRPRLGRVDRAAAKDLMSYASWAFVSNIAWTLRTQGAVVVINIMFGPAFNAGYAIALQLRNYAHNLGEAIGQAVQPAIVSQHAQGQQDNVHRLALITGKYTFIMLSFVFVPIIIEMPATLELWLGQVPPHAIELARLVLIWQLVNKLITGYSMALGATGDIGWWSRISLMLVVVSLALAVVLIKVFELGVWVVPATTLATMFVQTPLAAHLIGKRIGLTITDYLLRTIVPILICCIPATAAALGTMWLMPDALWRVVPVAAAYGIVAAPLFWFASLESWERQQFGRMVTALLTKLRPGAKSADADSTDDEL